MSASQTAITLDREDLDWFAVDPANPNSPQMAALWGDPGSGPYGALLLVPAGFVSPLHRHSRDERVLVIAGAARRWAEGEDPATAAVMTVGDFMMMPAGVNHVSAATDEGDCLELITQDGPFDFDLAEMDTDR